jgi:hypothetical protein
MASPIENPFATFAGPPLTRNSKKYLYLNHLPTFASRFRLWLL